MLLFEIVYVNPVVKRINVEYGIDGHLLMAIESLYCQPEVCGCVNGNQSKSFHVDFRLIDVELRQTCVLSPLFIIYMNGMDMLSRTDEFVTIGRCRISRLLFADDLVLLASS